MESFGNESEEALAVRITIRVIRSFPHRNIRNMLVKEVPLSLTTEQLLERVTNEVSSNSSLPPPFRRFAYDCLKIEHHAHGAKTSDPVINTENDEILLLRPGQSLFSQQVRDETEISLFRKEDYLEYKNLPAGTTQW